MGFYHSLPWLLFLPLLVSSLLLPLSISLLFASSFTLLPESHVQNPATAATLLSPPFSYLRFRLSTNKHFTPFCRPNLPTLLTTPICSGQLPGMLTWSSLRPSTLLSYSFRTRYQLLIVAYVKLGRLNDAHKALLSLPFPDVLSYTAVISCFAKSRREAEAVILLVRMMESGIVPNEFSYVAILTACIRTLDLELGLQVHALAVKLSYLDCLFVPNALMGLYSKCSARNLVLEVFNDMPKRDIMSWNTVISDAVKKSMYNRAFEFFRGMIRFDCFIADQFTLSALLAASAGCLAYLKGREVHAHALNSGFQYNLSVNNALIAFYTKSENPENVVALFEKAPNKDVITWTGMIVAYMEFGLVDLAMNVFCQMPERNCVSYNALLDGFFRNGEPSRVLNLFVRMLGEGAELSDSSLTSIICACGRLAELKTSLQIHGFVLKIGYGSNFHIESALINMYIKSGRMDDAQKLFGCWIFQEEDPVIWTSMICGYAREGTPEEAISLFHMKYAEGMKGVLSLTK